MASKIKAAQKEKEKEEAPEKEAPEAPDTPLPLLDLSDAAVKKLIRSAKKRGYVTHDLRRSSIWRCSGVSRSTSWSGACCPVPSRSRAG